MNKAAELAAHVRSVAHGLVPVTDNSLGNESSEVVIVLPGDTLDGDGNVGSWDGIITDADFRADELRLALLELGNSSGGLGSWLRWETGEVLLSKLDKLSVGDATSTDKDHAVSSVVGLDVVNKVLPLDALDVLCRAKDGAAERLSLESGGVKVVEDNLLELLVNLLGLSEDNIALTLDSGLLELGVLEDIGENVDGRGHIGIEGLCVVDGVLALLYISMLPLYHR